MVFHHTTALLLVVTASGVASPAQAFVPSPLLVGTRKWQRRPSVQWATARDELLEKAREMDQATPTTLPGSYADVSWSNRRGAVLTPAALPGVYVACRPFYWNTIDVGGRMTVVQLADKELWIHSPVALDEPLRQALATLGTVRHVVSPNYEHVKYAPQWSQAYPDACFWACPGLAAREPQVPWTGEIPSGVRPRGWGGSQQKQQYYGFDGTTPLWDFDQLQPLHMDCEVNPFTGRAFFNEVIFYHVASQSLIVTDLYWNYPTRNGIPNTELQQQIPNAIPQEDYGAWELAPAVDSVPWTSRLWKFGMDRLYAPFFKTFMIPSHRRDEFQTMVHSICHQWETETLIPAHGDIVRGKTWIPQVLTRFFDGTQNTFFSKKERG